MQTNRVIGTRYGKHEVFTLAPINARSIGATGFCLFLKTQSFTHTSLKKEQLLIFLENLKQSRYSTDKIFVHASYNINLCEWNQRLRKKYIKQLISELSLSQYLEFHQLNAHIGSCHSQLPAKDCLVLAAQFLDEALDAVPDVTITLENSSGFGAQLGANIDDIAQIIEMSSSPDRLGFALNTSHAFSFGYDYREPSSYSNFINTIDQAIGLDKLRLMFFNDSKSDFCSCTDIHENLGKGKMELKYFQYFLFDERLSHIPIILETPNSSLWNDEISFIKKNC